MIRHNKCFRCSCRFSSAVPVIYSSGLDTLIPSRRCNVDPCTLYAAAPDGAPTLTVSFICVIFLTMEMIVLMMNDFPVPPHPITVACNGLYFLLFLRNFTIVSIAAITTACCCLERFFREYLVPSFCFGISTLVLLLCFFYHHNTLL